MAEFGTSRTWLYHHHRPGTVRKRLDAQLVVWDAISRDDLQQIVFEPPKISRRANFPGQLLQPNLPHRLAAEVLACQLIDPAFQTAFQIKVGGVDREHPAFFD